MVTRLSAIWAVVGRDIQPQIRAAERAPWLVSTHTAASPVRVLAIRTPQGEMETTWVRQLLASNRTLYAGSYSSCKVPGYTGSCLKVCFPLPNGRAIVIMRSQVHPDGSLTVISDGREFGDCGVYFVVEHEGTAWARYVRTMKESIQVYVAEGDAARPFSARNALDSLGGIRSGEWEVLPRL